MPSIKKEAFTQIAQRYPDAKIPVAEAQQDSRLARVDVSRADLNGDGVIATEAEMSSLFDQVDRLDRNGDPGSVESLNPNVANALAACVENASGLPMKAYLLRAIGIDDSPPPSADTMLDASKFIVDNYAQNYGVQDNWFNLDAGHAVPPFREITTLGPMWKCNLFAGNVMAKAGYAPPYYGNVTERGEYPNANTFYQWTDKHAGRHGNPVHFELKSELWDLNEIEDYDERKAKTIETLLAAEPGDMIFVDHVGDEVSDGGHCRVVIENTMQPDGTGHILCAQASQDAARVKEDRLAKFMGEETIWVVKPNKPKVSDSNNG